MDVQSRIVVAPPFAAVEEEEEPSGAVGLWVVADEAGVGAHTQLVLHSVLSPQAVEQEARSPAVGEPAPVPEEAAARVKSQ